MGVKGLWSLLEGNSQIYQDIKFSNSELVVDGCNLAYHLFNMANLDQNPGGEYLAFQAHIPAALTSEKKGIYPPSVMSVFEQTLNDLRVPQVKCFGEADGRLAALAREVSCPLLSEDTDFYIYDLPEGVLPLAPFWKSVKDSPASSEIHCKLYTTTKFCTVFNIDPQLLPIFASLVKAEVKNMLRESMLEYELPSSPAPLLIGFLSKGTVPQLPAKLSSVPEWVRASLAMGGLGANILLHRRKILRIQVERCDLQSSNLISRPIRQVLYGLLLGQGGGAEVDEVDRDGLDAVNVEVKPEVEHQKLMLDSLPQVGHTDSFSWMTDE
ncbi:unnamed protein product [Gadus morhua 'NCC']